MSKNTRLPKLPLRFFRWYCHPDYREDIEGDLTERFEKRTEEKGKHAAKLRFTKEVIQLFRPGIIRSLDGGKQLNHYGMFKNYLKIAFRNISKQRIPSLLNIIGLSLGIASSLLIVLHLKQELSYEKSFPQADHIYRISNMEWANYSPPLKGFLQSHLPEAKLVSQIAPFGSDEIIRTELYKAEVPSGYYADAEFFKMFNLKFIYGKPTDALQAPFKVILTRKVATQFFGDKDPVGDVVIFNDKWDYEVIGVVEDLPKNSHLKIDYFVTMPTFYKHVDESWTSNRQWMVTYNFALFDDHTDIDKAHTKLRDLTYDYFPEATQEEIDDHQGHLVMYPIRDIHLHSQREQEMSVNSDISLVYIFSALAMFIILIACVNFINVFTTQAIKRTKEIGVRKVLGARRVQLVVQFLGEAFLMTFLAAGLAIVLTLLSLESYNKLIEIPLSFSDLWTVEHLQVLGALVVTVGLLSGTYPAFYISQQRIQSTLKSQKAPGSASSFLRKSLVVFQFAISITMMVGTAVVYLQMKYIQEKDLGFDKEQVIGIKFYGEFRKHVEQNWESFCHELKQHPAIVKVARASDLAGDRLSAESVVPEGIDPDWEDFSSVRVMRIDENYLEAMGIELLEGRDFIATKDTSAAFILNRQAIDVLHLSNPVGQVLQNNTRQRKGKVVGVIDDFHFAALHQEIEPLVLSYNPYWARRLVIKLKGNDPQKALDFLESKVKTAVPGTLFDYIFLDDKLDRLYKAENNMHKVVNIFSLLAILISCLGLFGLSAYTAEVRTKEIGIRKVLGAKSMNIISIMTMDFTKMILIAIIIALPMSYFIAVHWLDDFAFRIGLSWWIFAGVGVLTLMIAWLTMSFQTVKLANTNPVETLRNE
ncbi:FtsX-like permease family protein [Fulvivirga sp. M361]|uniref:ABC transporter permease n=1 Tax=Fulvivirga sp. M361 TaxID=2594266 RepID=UPI00117BC965|nr:ABC transporter permease [Fulvivirga sp. M361]TRX56169.1 FtsX-like permease family protein [Fulvivirga sp. M361]